MSERDTENWLVWDAEAAIWQEQDGVSLAEARNAVIERWLFNGGNPGPYFDWVLNEGHFPSKRIIRAIALMFAKSAGVLSPEQVTHVPFGLEVQRKGAARPVDLAAQVRDFLAGREASQMIDAGAKARDEADPAVQSWLASNGLNVSQSTVEAARKRYRRHRGKKFPG